MDTHPTPQPGEAADFVARLVSGLERAGLFSTVKEPSTCIVVHAPNASPHMDEMITLRPDADEVLTWYWSWDSPVRPARIGPARDVVALVRLINNVVGAVNA